MPHMIMTVNLNVCVLERPPHRFPTVSAMLKTESPSLRSHFLSKMQLASLDQPRHFKEEAQQVSRNGRNAAAAAEVAADAATEAKSKAFTQT
ncbi:hypothetical protein HPB50_010354 [Hyalomma asiaticum]|uniref:Uncharacterized protein n=1 Tax=Hyalomma asiaticum TaxID=266040 RepID=A0ACB7RZV5_HYAAI|nr:hypothetical protein HPB50_010354 [Hyalomma asiaticum]